MPRPLSALTDAAVVSEAAGEEDVLVAVSGWYEVTVPRAGQQIYTDYGIVATREDGLARMSPQQAQAFRNLGFRAEPTTIPMILTAEELASQAEAEVAARLDGMHERNRAKRLADEYASSQSGVFAQA